MFQYFKRWVDSIFKPNHILSISVDNQSDTEISPEKINQCVRKIKDGFYEFASEGSGGGIVTELEYLGNKDAPVESVKPNTKMNWQFGFQANDNFSAHRFNILVSQYVKSISEDPNLPEGVRFDVSVEKIQTPESSRNSHRL
jgi:hypothetical protein